MGHSEEEIYVTLVVVKRPPGTSGANLDPASWTDLILNGLVPEGANHRAEVLTRRLPHGHAMSGRMPGRAAPGIWTQGHPPRPKQGRPWTYLLLGALCLGLAAYLAQLLLK